jgi:hypothetical protein
MPRKLPKRAEFHASSSFIPRKAGFREKGSYFPRKAGFGYSGWRIPRKAEKSSFATVGMHALILKSRRFQNALINIQLKD